MAVPREPNRDDRSGDLFGKLKADVRATTQTRKRSAAAALRILFVTGVRSLPEAYLLVQHKNRSFGARALNCSIISVELILRIVASHILEGKVREGQTLYVDANTALITHNNHRTPSFGRRTDLDERT